MTRTRVAAGCAIVIAAGESFVARIVAGEMSASRLIERVRATDCLCVGDRTAEATLLDRHGARSAVASVALLGATMDAAVE